MSQGQNFGDEGSSLSDGRAPQSRRLYVGTVITHYIWRPIPSGVVAMGVAPPDIFNLKKIELCKKHFAQVFE